jgi:hypothetical protein
MKNIGKSLESSEAVFEIPRAGTYEIDIGYVFTPPIRPYQTLEFCIGKLPIGKVRVFNPCTVSFFIPEKGNLGIRLPEASRPIDVACGQDTRTLSIGIADFRFGSGYQLFSGIRVRGREIDTIVASLNLSREELALCVESLGDNCELGMVQRVLGAEPLGLFRFASTSSTSLISALEDRLKGLGAPGTLSLLLQGEQGEYMVKDNQYGLLYHTWVFARDADGAQILAREYKRLPFLARKFIEDVTSGEKVFVYREHNNLESVSEQRLYSALRNIGPSHLLVVKRADASHAAGAFEGRLDGPCRAWIDYRGSDWWMIAETWISTLAMAARLRGCLGTPSV